MADKPTEKVPYYKKVLHFYFAPEMRSFGTLVYVFIYGYFTIYYIDNLFLAIKFLFYILFGHTALANIALLFTGMAFVISLTIPFFLSLYSIFLLHVIWDKSHWAQYLKWAVSVAIIISSVCIIIFSDSAARFAARRPVMQDFVYYANIESRI